MEITPRILNSFLILAEEEHFRRAAERLYITSPALSQQIRQLESHLKVTLFDRNSRSVTLTDRGAELIPLARQVIDATDAVTDWADAAARTRRVLTVGFMSTGVGRVTSQLLETASERLPDLDIQLRYTDWGNQLDGVIQGDVDLAFVREPEPPGELTAVPVLEEPRIVLLPASHPLAEQDSVEFADIAGETFLPSATGSTSWRNYWLVVPRPDGEPPVLGPAISSVEDMLEYVAAGRGVALSAASLSSFYIHPGVSFVPVIDLAQTKVLLCRRRADRNPDALRFEAMVRSLTAPAHRTAAGSLRRGTST
ncbi:LysR family transcriptional regulator [Corynebacterium glyciniphilum]|uniref:LysR family transcriptional regulator n=1 Tax=Corynebacterium glyciniphilum TaxID=1404244 RepID=UPI003DA03BEC